MNFFEDFFRCSRCIFSISSHFLIRDLSTVIQATLVVGRCTSHPGVLGSIPNERTRERENRAPPCVKVPGSSRVPVCDGQTSPHRHRLVVSRSTCPPLSPSSHANSFVIGTAVIITHPEKHELPNQLRRTAKEWMRQKYKLLLAKGDIKKWQQDYPDPVSSHSSNADQKQARMNYCNGSSGKGAVC